MGKNDKEKPQPEKQRETTVEFLASLAGVLVTGLFIITFVLQAFVIPSSSMEKTLLIGDHVFVNRIAFSPPTRWVGPLIPYTHPHRGDIVVFLSMDPRTPDLNIVKRIIGVPGDHIHLRDGFVYRNGEKLDEPYVIRVGPIFRDAYRDNFPSVSPLDESNATDDWKLEMGSHIENGDIVVPPDSYFAMGDNRNVSLDSRYWGFITKDHLIGRPMFVYWSFEAPEEEIEQTSMGQRLAFAAHVVLHFFDKTRWSRTLRFVR